MVLKMEFDGRTEQRFREIAMKKFGYSKGALKKAGKEAIIHWISEENVSLPVVDDPFPLIEGIMKHLRGKHTSVELQHGAVELWSAKK